jgi:hypothetical protein
MPTLIKIGWRWLGEDAPSIIIRGSLVQIRLPPQVHGFNHGPIAVAKIFDFLLAGSFAIHSMLSYIFLAGIFQYRDHFGRQKFFTFGKQLS